MQLKVLTTINCFQAAKERANKFCVDRDWSQFHTPVNIVLALSGECGEVCEIFQWKGSLDSFDKDNHNDKFKDNELINIGEEIADVFIYSTRLCDICNIDMAYSVRHLMMLNTLSPMNINDDKMIVSDRNLPWDNLSFDELDEYVNSKVLSSFRSQRHIVLSIQSEIGQVTNIFKSKPEIDSSVGLPNWKKSEITTVASHIATICILLACLARLSKHNLGKCIYDKFSKNEKKYPVDLSKGSNAKYTDYIDKIKEKKISNKVYSFLSHPIIKYGTVATVSLLIGYHIGTNPYPIMDFLKKIGLKK